MNKEDPFSGIKRFRRKDKKRRSREDKFDRSRVIESLRVVYSVMARGREEHLTERGKSRLKSAGLSFDELQSSESEEVEKMIRLACSRWDSICFEEDVKIPVQKKELYSQLEEYEDVFTYRQYRNTQDAIREGNIEQVREKLERKEAVKPENTSKWWKIWE